MELGSVKMARSATLAILILVIALLVANLALGEEDRGEDKASDALRSNGCLVNLYKW